MKSWQWQGWSESVRDRVIKMEKRIKASAFYLGHVEISNKWLTNRELITKIKDKRIKAYIDSHPALCLGLALSTNNYYYQLCEYWEILDLFINNSNTFLHLRPLLGEFWNRLMDWNPRTRPDQTVKNVVNSLNFSLSFIDPLILSRRKLS